MKRILVIISVALFVAVGSIFLVMAFSPPTGKPAVTVSLIGFTNDAAGTRLAAVTLSNASPWAVSRQSKYVVSGPMPARTKITEGWLSTGGRRLGPGSAEIVTLPAPTNHSEWRVAFLSSKAEGLIFSLAGELVLEAKRLGLRTRYRREGYWASSDLIQEQQ